MNRKYKIGDISKLFDIPVQTLRFYEEKNIITPFKDENNGYRYYDVWNINNLIDTMILRESDFSLQQIDCILNTNNLDDMSREYMKQETLLLEKITHYKNVLNAVSAQRLKIQNFQHQIGRFTKCTNKGLVYYRYREKNIFKTNSKEEDLKLLSTELSPWIEILPLATPTFYISYYDLNQEVRTDTSYWWGFSIPYDEAEKYGLKPQEPNEYIPSMNCLYTVFEAEEEGTFITSFYEQVYDKIVKQGYMISGSPFGKLIVKTHEQDGYKRYFEVWVPVS